MDHIGIDVHKRESQIYILAESGEVIERRIRTEPERFDAVLGTRPRARIVIEASTDSEWVARCLPAHGHPEPGARRGSPLGRHEDGRPQDGSDLPALCDRERRRPSRGAPQARRGVGRGQAATGTIAGTIGAGGHL